MGRDRHKSRYLSDSSRSNSRSSSRSRSNSSDRKHSSRRKDKAYSGSHKKKNRSRSNSNNRRRDRRSRSGSSNRDRTRRRSRDRRDTRDRRSSRERRDNGRDRDRRDDHRTRNEEDNKEETGQANAQNGENPEEPPIEVEKPCFIPSGILAKFTNTVNGVVLKFTEPPEAAVPTDRWKIYPFKGEEALPVLHLHRQSCFLIGKDAAVADIHVEHPTCSSQHAVIQFRESKRYEGELQELVTEIRPYLMDLESKNGTFLNGEKLEPARYYQLLPKDVIKLANSSRDYVVMRD